MRAQVEKKLWSHHKNDIERLGCNGIFPIENAIAMIEATEGVCPLCKCQLKLTGWAPMDPTQFSFDRLNDALPHSEENCRVVCLGCNLKKADDQYKPTASFRDYVIIKKLFFRLKAYLTDRARYKDPIAKTLTTDCRILESTLHSLHDGAFGVAKKNNWKPYVAPLPAASAVSDAYAIVNKYPRTSSVRRSGSSSDSL